MWMDHTQTVPTLIQRLPPMLEWRLDSTSRHCSLCSGPARVSAHLSHLGLGWRKVSRRWQSWGPLLEQLKDLSVRGVSPRQTQHLGWGYLSMASPRYFQNQPNTHPR